MRCVIHGQYKVYATALLTYTKFSLVSLLVLSYSADIITLPGYITTHFKPQHPPSSMPSSALDVFSCVEV